MKNTPIKHLEDIEIKYSSNITNTVARLRKYWFEMQPLSNNIKIYKDIYYSNNAKVLCEFIFKDIWC